MKTKFLEQMTSTYDGTQLRPLYAYLEHKVQGDSCISWLGACDVSFEHMVDGEDLLGKSEIKGSRMLHFLFEIFDRELVSGIFLQRLFASLVADEIFNRTQIKLQREGDDLYWDQKKLSISIATRSSVSVLVHFAMNVSNQGTPVSTCSLEDFKLNPKELSLTLMKKISDEYESILTARLKVRPV